MFINISAYVALVALGYRSSVVTDTWRDYGPSLRTGAYALVVLGFVALTAATAAASYSHIAFEQDVNSGVQATLSEGSYQGLELVGVRTQYDDAGLLGTPESVTVAVVADADRVYPSLADDIREQVRANTGHDITVEVNTLDYQRSVGSPETTPNPVVRWTADASRRVAGVVRQGVVGPSAVVGPAVAGTAPAARPQPLPVRYPHVRV